MANEPIVQLNSFVKKIEKTITGDLVSPESLRRIGEQTAERIAKRTRLGYGVAYNGAVKTQLKSMRRHSESYRQYRFEHSDRLSPLTAPGKHNLTLTGEMLSRLTVIKVDSNAKRVDLGFTDEFSRIKASVNSKRGWKFLHLSDIEIKALTNFYKRELARLVREKF